jgi:hypothetical protein
MNSTSAGPVLQRKEGAGLKNLGCCKEFYDPAPIGIEVRVKR